CEAALKQLQDVVDVNALGELTVESFEEHKHVITDDLLMRRARHAVYENVRTDRAAEALKAGELGTFGEYMNESHKSLDEDYEVTIKATDYLARAAWKEAGVVGARMTGGGFGGCCIAIVENEEVERFIANVGNGFKEEIGREAEFYIAETADGTKEWVENGE
ncbi:MAG: galactokinase, partial [Alkalibacterium sp.]